MRPRPALLVADAGCLLSFVRASRVVSWRVGLCSPGSPTILLSVLLATLTFLDMSTKQRLTCCVVCKHSSLRSFGGADKRDLHVRHQRDGIFSCDMCQEVQTKTCSDKSCCSSRSCCCRRGTIKRHFDQEPRVGKFGLLRRTGAAWQKDFLKHHRHSHK